MSLVGEYLARLKVLATKFLHPARDRIVFIRSPGEHEARGFPTEFAKTMARVNITPIAMPIGYIRAGERLMQKLKDEQDAVGVQQLESDHREIRPKPDPV